MAVLLRNSGGQVVTSSVEREKYVRNPEYLNLPTLVNGDEKIYLLAKIYEHSNYFRLYATGDYQIDWGDGQGVQTYTSGTYADYEIDWNNISASTVTSLGYRQAIITVEPQAGASLNVFQCWGSATNPNDPINNNPQIVDVKMAGQNFTNLGLAFATNSGLEQFEFVGTAPNLTSVNSMFKSSSIEKIVSIDTSNVTNFADFLAGATKLIEVPKFDLSSATSVINMFENNSRITYLEPYDLDVDAPSLTSIQYMFDGLSVVNVPITSCSNIIDFTGAFINNKFQTFNLPCPAATNTSYMFDGCSELETVTTNFPSTITNTTSMFNACSKLKSITPFDTSNVTNCPNMFVGTSRLQDVSWLDLSSSTNISEMFQNSRIENVDINFNTSATLSSRELFYGNTYIVNPSSLDGISIDSMFRFFRGCVNLERVPLMDVSAVTDIRQSFGSCNKIISLPAWDLSGVTLSDTITFGGCLSLRESNIYGLTKSHAYNNCQLDRDAIVNIFNNLGTAVSQTIYVNNNPGSANLTAGDIAIATGKGWTVVN